MDLSTQISPVNRQESTPQDYTGMSKGRLISFTDLTHKKNYTSRSQRKDRLAAMGELVAKIAHEVRNPLGSIELFATSLQASLEGQPDLQLLAKRISAGVKSIDAIISNMLMFIRPNESRHFESFDIYEVLDDALFFTNHLTGKPNGINVELAFLQRPLFVNGDLELMKQACLNIILNAIQGMPNGGKLGISTFKKASAGKESQDWLEIHISDEGEGIAAQHQSKIFDPFFTTKEKGTGLGLSIVHSIIQIHDGYIDVESTPGRGTVFSIGLPLCSDSQLIPQLDGETRLEREASK